MTLKQLTKMPYYGTPSSEHKSEIDVDRVLNKYGVKNIRWTTVEGKKLLEFIHQPVKNQPSVHVKIPVPEVEAIHYGKTVVVPLKQRMRMVYYFVKSMLEAVHYGLYKMEEVFFGFVELQLPDGEKISTVDLLNRYQDSARLLEE